MEAAQTGDRVVGAEASSGWWHAATSGAREVRPGAGDREGRAGPHHPGGGVGVSPPHRAQREPSGDGADAAEARAHAKKKSLTATEQGEPRIQKLRRGFIAYVKTLDPRRLVFLDEAGSHIAMTRDYGRAPRGERVHGCVPRNRGEVTTMIGALDVRGMRAMMTVEGGTDADVFEAFVEQVLVGKLRSEE